LNNCRSEPAPRTPKKPPLLQQQPASAHTPPAPQRHQMPTTPLSKGRPLSVTSDETNFEWSSSNDLDLVEIAQSVAMAPPETPRKIARNIVFASPGKRNYSEMVEGTSEFSATVSNDDVFNTPRSSEEANGLLSPAETPLRRKPYGQAPYSIVPTDSGLAKDALRVLGGSKLCVEVEQQLVDLLNKHDLRTQGIAKGRDITRLALSNKEQKIAELEARITGLEAERETSRAVIAHLKADLIQTSPRKSRKS
jgi:hypothetical protein